MSGKPEAFRNPREEARRRRHAIRDRLARGVYEREKARDQTDRNRQSSWEDLNEGRRATRLNYADELLTTLVGALGLTSSIHRSTARWNALVGHGRRALRAASKPQMKRNSWRTSSPRWSPGL